MSYNCESNTGPCWARQQGDHSCDLFMTQVGEDSVSALSSLFHSCLLDTSHHLHIPSAVSHHNAHMYLLPLFSTYSYQSHQITPSHEHFIVTPLHVLNMYVKTKWRIITCTSCFLLLSSVCKAELTGSWLTFVFRRLTGQWYQSFIECWQESVGPEVFSQ